VCDNEIPLNAWVNADIPRDLAATIIELARVSTLPLSTKLRNIMEAIARYYTKRLTQNENDVKVIQKDCAEKIANANKFWSQLGAVFDAQSVSVERFEQDPHLVNDLIEKIDRIQQENRDLLREKAMLEDETLPLLVRLGANTLQEATTEVDRLCDIIIQLESRLKVERKRNRIAGSNSCESETHRRTREYTKCNRETKC
jgi:hypothetical protein